MTKISFSITDPTETMEPREGANHRLVISVSAGNPATIVSYRPWTLTDSELYELYKAIETRVTGLQLDRLAALSEQA
jgi:hypothetical protein